MDRRLQFYFKGCNDNFSTQGTKISTSAKWRRPKPRVHRGRKSFCAMEFSCHSPLHHVSSAGSWPDLVVQCLCQWVHGCSKNFSSSSSLEVRERGWKHLPLRNCFLSLAEHRCSLNPMEEFTLTHSLAYLLVWLRGLVRKINSWDRSQVDSSVQTLDNCFQKWQNLCCGEEPSGYQKRKSIIQCQWNNFSGHDSPWDDGPWDDGPWMWSLRWWSLECWFFERWWFLGWWSLGIHGAEHGNCRK